MSFEAAGDLKLLALKKVGKPRRVHLDQARPTADLEPQVGANGPADLVRERPNLRFQMLIRANVGATAGGLFRQQIEQVRIDVVADSERVNPDSAAIAAIEFSRISDVSFSPTVGRPSVRNRT